jgi:valyl-tRNA synthetase
VGRRLVTKLFNAAKFVLSQSGKPGPVTRPLDLAFLARLREMVEQASGELEAFEYAGALDVAERFFWSRFTDAYVEIVKARARSETDPEGRTSAVAALQLALGVLVRLFAPYLPYVTEEIWSWGFDAESGHASVHRAPWPGAGDFQGLGPAEPAAFDAALAFLEAVHRAKSGSGASVGRHLRRLRVACAPATAELIASSLSDLLAAARVDEHTIEASEASPPLAFDVLEIVLADRPEREQRGA